MDTFKLVLAVVGAITLAVVTAIGIVITVLKFSKGIATAFHYVGERLCSLQAAEQE